jgi:hypothetical protein
MVVCWNFKFLFSFVEKTCDHFTQTSEVWTYLQVLFVSFYCLVKLLNVAMVQNIEVILGQMMNYSV